jgi:glycosyltransferase involved in cell wall biosynthesis
MKILITALSFQNLTGSEIYTFELAKGLSNLGFDITILSYQINNPILEMSNDLPNINYLNYNRDNDYSGYDLIILQHGVMFKKILSLDTPTINIIHSEIINLEEPIINSNIKYYVAIRPEIKKHIVDNFHIDENLVRVIYNPIDTDKFNMVNTTEIRDKKRILFVGTVDYLRRNTIQDLIDVTRENNQELWIVGKKNDTYLDDMIANQPHVTYHESTPNIENYIHQCDETAGILLGRTTIEGWMCGKAGWIYDVDYTGRILSKELHQVPSDIEKYYSSNVIKDIFQLIINALDLLTFKYKGINGEDVEYYQTKNYINIKKIHKIT